MRSVFLFFTDLTYVHQYIFLAMNIAPKLAIPLFYWKTDVESFIAAGLAKDLFLGKAPAEIIPVSEGDEIVDLKEKYPVFFGVRFDKLFKMPDITESINCAIINRWDQLETMMAGIPQMPQREKLPRQHRMNKKPALLWRITFDDISSIIRLGSENFATPERVEEIMPPFIKHIVSCFEKADEVPDSREFVVGASKEISFLNADYPTFSKTFVTPFPQKKEEIINNFVEVGKKAATEEELLTRRLVERNAILAEFAGHQVKIINLPAEMADKAGAIMAVNMPFAVVFEDVMRENKRNYHLYSTRGGVNLLEVAKAYNPEGTPRRVTFSVPINFNNYKFI